MVRDYDAQRDLWPCIRLMQAAKQGCLWYRYGQMDGSGLVEEHGGVLRGYLRYTLGRPETHIRQFVVAPEFQGDGTVAYALLSELVRRAIKHGSLGIEGFQSESNAVMAGMMARIGAQLTRGTRARFPLIDGISSEATQWRERCVRESKT